jgi:transcriptional regulator with XRE-family HTH domain
MVTSLDNYLRTYRKRFGLSQREMAFLLGCASGAKISRYERNARRPSLETLLAYERIFDVSIRELFAGVYEKVAAITEKRARVLARRLSAAAPTPLTARQLEQLRHLSSGSGSKPDRRDAGPRH